MPREKSQKFAVKLDTEFIRKGDSVAVIFYLDTITDKQSLLVSHFTGIDSIVFYYENGDVELIKSKHYYFDYPVSKDTIRNQLVILTDFYVPGQPDENTRITAIVFSNNQSFILQQDYKKQMMEQMLSSHIKHLAVYPDISINGNHINFKILAIRLNPSTHSYFPNSEFFRVQLFSNMRPVWNSSEGMDYLMAIYDVKPERQGEVAEYTRIWDCETSTGKTAPEGDYRAILTLPIKPSPTVIETYFYYGENDD